MTGALFLLLIPSLATAAPHRATGADKERIASELAAIAASSGAIREHLVIEKEFMRSLGLLDSMDHLIRRATADDLKRLDDDDLARYGRNMQELRSLIAAARLHADTAIKMTLKSYGISDPVSPPSGPILSGPPPQPGIPDALPTYLGKQVRFNPQFGLNMLPGTDRYGYTGNDGSVSIGWDAFAYPGKLAMTLYHESLHFKELLAPGVDIVNIPAAESRLRKNEPQLWSSVFELQPSDIGKRTIQRRRYAEQAPLWNRLVREGINPYTKNGQGALLSAINAHGGTAGENPQQPGTHDGLEDIFEGSGALQTAIDEELHQREALRRQEEGSRREEARVEADRRARQILTMWVENECKNGSLPDSLTSDQVRQAYEDLSIVGAVVNLWDLPYYTGIPCTALTINLLMLDKLRAHPFRDWDDWFNIVTIANERSHSSAPSAPNPTPQDPFPSPTQPGPGEDPGHPGPTPPPVPHCRFHPWCQG